MIYSEKVKIITATISCAIASIICTRDTLWIAFLTLVWNVNIDILTYRANSVASSNSNIFVINNGRRNIFTRITIIKSVTCTSCTSYMAWLANISNFLTVLTYLAKLNTCVRIQKQFKAIASQTTRCAVYRYVRASLTVCIA